MIPPPKMPVDVMAEAAGLHLGTVLVGEVDGGPAPAVAPHCRVVLQSVAGPVLVHVHAAQVAFSIAATFRSGDVDARGQQLPRGVRLRPPVRPRRAPGVTGRHHPANLMPRLKLTTLPGLFIRRGLRILREMWRPTSAYFAQRAGDWGPTSSEGIRQLDR